MSNKNQIHAVPHGVQWRVIYGDRVIAVYGTQHEAQAYAITYAKIYRLEVLVWGTDGKIRSKDSYGNDPRSIKDREH